MTRDTTATPGPRLPWAGKTVNIEEVEEHLSHLWRMTADNVRTSQNINVRTSVLNFVICAPDIETAQQASATIRDLSSTHVARVILLILDSSEGVPSAVTTWATLRSFPIISDTMRHNFEQVTVLIAGSAIRSTSNILQPLLKPHLPTYIWWLGDPPGSSELFLDLNQLSTRIIVDSNSFFTPEQSLITLASLLDRAPNCALSDLNWGRLTPWRALIAQFFDVLEYKPYLAGVDTVEIEHAAAPFAQLTRTEQGDVSPNPTRALFLAAWLKTRLGWKLPPDAAHTYHDVNIGVYDWQMHRNGGPLPRGSGRTGKLVHQTHGQIHLRPRSDLPIRPGAICLFRMVSTIEGKQAVFTINREDQEHVLTSVELAQGTRPQRTVSMDAEHPVSELLHEELEIMGRDELYEQTLREVTHLL